MPATRPSQATIRNALAAWKAAGLQIGEMTVGDGTVTIKAPVAGIAPGVQPAADAYEEWRAKKDAKRAHEGRP